MASYYTIKDMAKEFNCTYEAVRQQAIRYKKEIDSHSHLDGKTRYYDDWAVDFLRNHRSKNPIIVEKQDTNEQLEQLQQENKALLIKVAEQAEELNQSYKTALLAEQSQAEIKARLQKESEAHQETIEESKAMKKEIAELKDQLEIKSEQLKEKKEQLEAEQGRKLSWTERFRGRKKVK